MISIPASIYGKVPIGEYPELVAQGLRDTGSENYGGPCSLGERPTLHRRHNHKLRIFESQTGRLLRQTELPYAGIGTPGDLPNRREAVRRDCDRQRAQRERTSGLCLRRLSAALSIIPTESRETSIP
jgi:hypothetical protein